MERAMAKIHDVVVVGAGPGGASTAHYLASNGLDVMATRALRELIRQLRATGKCVLFSSHVMQEVAALCDEIVIISSGKVAIHDTPDGIRQTTGCEDLEEAFVKAIDMVELVE